MLWQYVIVTTKNNNLRRVCMLNAYQYLFELHFPTDCPWHIWQNNYSTPLFLTSPDAYTVCVKADVLIKDFQSSFHVYFIHIYMH